MALFSPELYEFLISGFSRVFFLIMGLFGIGFLIGFHELGHFLFCKLFQVRTPSFSIGMGPRIIQKKIGDTNFALSAIPLGGYVEIAGAADESSEPAESRTPDKYSFAKKPYYQKMAILAGGHILQPNICLCSIYSGFYTWPTKI